jgi:hypothetical protein
LMQQQAPQTPGQPQQQQQQVHAQVQNQQMRPRWQAPGTFVQQPGQVSADY